MKRIFSTDDVKPADRYDCWHELMCRYVIGHDSVPECRLTFAGNLDTAVLADLALASFETSSLTCVHGRRHIEPVANELILVRLTKGHLVLEQNDRTVSLTAGDMTLVDPRLVYNSRLAAGSGLLAAKYPRRNLIERVGKTDAFVARKLTADSGETGLLSEYLRALPPHTEALGTSAGQVSQHLLDLIAVGLWKAGGTQVPRVASSRAVLGMQLRATIEKNLANPAATALSIARSVGIGLRYANSILSQDDTSVGRLLQARRLEHCRRALADPLKRHRSISNIAYAFGFTDMTHFGRRFRRAFGLLPSDYRKLQRDTRVSFNS